MPFHDVETRPQCFAGETPNKSTSRVVDAKTYVLSCSQLEADLSHVSKWIRCARAITREKQMEHESVYGSTLAPNDHCVTELMYDIVEVEAKDVGTEWQDRSMPD